MRRASRLPAATTAPITQKMAPAPIAAPATPNISGIVVLEKLIAIERKAIASPCRSGGVTWCKVDITIGCTDPSTSPSTSAHTPMPQAVGTKG